jgi:uncharacterized protein (TIGR02147 family)
MNLFKYIKYKDFLTDWIDASPNKGRGVRKKFADAAGCQLPYVSHVLNGDYHFNSEQIDGIAHLLKLRQVEHEYLLLLVQYERAGTVTLKKFYKKLIEDMALKNSTIKGKLKSKNSLSNLDRNIYYSEWTYSAIHMLATIPKFRTFNQIVEQLQLPLAKVEFYVEKLISMGLMKFTNGEFHSLQVDLHLDNDSVNIRQHHTNWRLKALNSLDNIQEHHLHYSLAFTIKKEDFIKVREIISSAIKESADIIRPSEEEELAVLNIDLFDLTKS